jgi:hypothetical protein
VLSIAAASVAARLWLLVQRPLWFDEIFTVWAACLPIESLLSVLRNDSGPPLFYVLEKPFVLAAERLFHSDAAARLLPFLAILGIFAGVRALPSSGPRRRFVLLAAASPLLLLYSAEARAYGLLALLVFALFLLAAVSRETPAALAAIAVLSAAALYTHYLAVFAVGAIVLVAAAEKRWRPALAAVAGSLTFLFWVPVLKSQPPAAMAWMEERSADVVLGFFSALGGAGRVPPPLGPLLPAPLVVLGAVLFVLLAIGLALRWREEPAVRRAAAFLVLFFGAALFASRAGPVAFAGRTEMAVLPVWIWAIALGGERSRLVRLAGVASFAVAGISFALLLAPRTESYPSRVLDALVANGRREDVLFAGAHFYLPARLAAERGRLPMAVHAFPAEQAAHPGWTAGARPTRDDLAAVEAALERVPPRGRIFFLVPPSYARVLGPLVSGRGVRRRLAGSEEMLFFSWSRN